MLIVCVCVCARARVCACVCVCVCVVGFGWSVIYLCEVSPNEGLLHAAIHSERDEKHLGRGPDQVLGGGDQQFRGQLPVFHGRFFVQFDGVQQQRHNHHGCHGAEQVDDAQGPYLGDRQLRQVDDTYAAYLGNRQDR